MRRICLGLGVSDLATAVDGCWSFPLRPRTTILPQLSLTEAAMSIVLPRARLLAADISRHRLDRFEILLGRILS